MCPGRKESSHILRERRGSRLGARPGASGPPASVGVLVLAPGPGLLGLGLGRSFKQERVVRRDEWVRSHDGVGVVDPSVLTGEGDPARTLAQPVLERRAN